MKNYYKKKFEKRIKKVISKKSKLTVELHWMHLKVEQKVESIIDKVKQRDLEDSIYEVE